MLSKFFFLDSNLPSTLLITVAAIKVFFWKFFYLEVFHCREFKDICANDIGLQILCKFKFLTSFRVFS